jgi:predicted RNA-binding Zn ribbon-like protein
MESVLAFAEGVDGPAPAELQAAVSQLLAAAADGTAPSAHALDVVNSAALLARSAPQLNWPAGGRPTSWETREARPGDAAAAEVAQALIALLTGAQGDRIRRCPAAGCGRIFVATDPRQRWCSPGCGNRTRVARHAARRRLAGLDG